MSSQESGLSPRNCDLLKAIYYNSSHPSSFGSIRKLYNSVKNISNLTFNDVRNWLKQQNAYTLHRQRRVNYKRNKVIVESVDEQFQADIVDMQSFPTENDGYKYILTCVDILSKFAFAIPLKNKGSREVKKAFEKIFASRVPQKIQTDRGKEFLNKDVSVLFKSLNINHFTTKNDEIKCSNVERFNRTLKSKMWKYFTAKGTRRWIDKLDEFLESYNNSKHSKTKFKPTNVNDSNASRVFENIYGYATMRDYLKAVKKISKFKIGDEVRIPHKLSTFDKKFYPLWTDTVFKITDIVGGEKKPYFKLKVGNETINKRFYPEEIQQVEVEEFRIERILSERIVNGKKEYLVKWLGYPDSVNSWEPEENLRLLRNG